jgi:hypothetical protein
MTLQTTDSFLPLTSASSSDQSREFRIAVIPQADTAPGFKNLAQMNTAESANSSTSDRKNCAPRLSLQRDGDRITSIRVQCSCGQVIDLACVYDNASIAK